VVVVHHFLSNGTLALRALLIIIACFSAAASAQSADPFSANNTNGYLARILSDSPEEVAGALARAEAWHAEGKLPPGANPIAIILHGPEVEIFFKDNYEEYKKIVDLAARLSAFGVVDVRVCETQSGIMGRSRSSIHPFIGTVPFGPTEVKRLLDQQSYVYF
jgi:intracellular sulfur oxidation DsrE/DsrF family protein